MYHGEQGEIPYSSTAKHHSIISKNIGDILIKYIADKKHRGQINKKDLVFADFGTCDGALALNIVKILIDHVKGVGYGHCTVCLNDIPSNDFNLLAATFTDSDLYSKGDVSILMNIGNMLNQCLAPGSVTIAMHTLSCEENRCRDTLFATQNREHYSSLAAENWRRFLDSRSVELKTGGILVTTVAVYTEGHLFWELVSKEWDDALQTGLIEKEEHQRCLIPVYLRTTEEVMEPFKDGVFKGLRLVSTDAYIIDYVHQDPDNNGIRNMDVYAKKFIRRIIPWTRNYIIQSLDTNRSEKEKRTILDVFYDRVREKTAVSPYKQICFNLIDVVTVKD